MTCQEIMAKMDRVDDDWSSTLTCKKCNRSFTWHGFKDDGLAFWVASHQGCYKESDPKGVTTVVEKEIW